MRYPNEPLDVIFVSSNEPNADENYARLLTFAPLAKRIRGAPGIYEAYQAAANASTTVFFFMVDGDNWILDNFCFSDHYHNNVADKYNWLAINPINGLISSNGAIKLLRTDLVLGMAPKARDFYLSMKGFPGQILKPASEHRFNSSPEQAWRSAFRECAKMTGGLFQITPEKQRELLVWQTCGADKPNGVFCILGARMGAAFGREHRRQASLKRINNQVFLARMFADATQDLNALDILHEPLSAPPASGASGS